MAGFQVRALDAAVYSVVALRVVHFCAGMNSVFCALCCLASSGAYLKIRRFATTQNLVISSPRNSIYFRVLPFSWNKEMRFLILSGFSAPHFP